MSCQLTIGNKTAQLAVVEYSTNPGLYVGTLRITDRITNLWKDYFYIPSGECPGVPGKDQHNKDCIGLVVRALNHRIDVIKFSAILHDQQPGLVICVPCHDEITGDRTIGFKIHDDWAKIIGANGFAIGGISLNQEVEKLTDQNCEEFISKFKNFSKPGFFYISDKEYASEVAELSVFAALFRGAMQQSACVPVSRSVALTAAIITIPTSQTARVASATNACVVQEEDERKEKESDLRQRDEQKSDSPPRQVVAVSRPQKKECTIM